MTSMIIKITNILSLLLYEVNDNNKDYKQSILLYDVDNNKDYKLIIIIIIVVVVIIIIII